MAQSPCQTQPTAGFTATCSTSRAEVFVDTTERVTVQTYSTRLLAVLDGTATVYDLSFAAAFADPVVQAALAAAEAALAAAAAPDPVALAGPTTPGATTSLIGSVTGSPVVTGSTVVVETTAGIMVGPGTIQIGDLGLCTGTGPVFRQDPGGTGVPTNCSGGSPQTFAVIAGEINTNTNVNALTTTFRSITVTDTLLTSAVYTLAGTTQRATAVDAPGVLGLGLAAWVAWAAGGRRDPRGSRGPSPVSSAASTRVGGHAAACRVGPMRDRPRPS